MLALDPVVLDQAAARVAAVADAVAFRTSEAACHDVAAALPGSATAAAARWLATELDAAAAAWAEQLRDLCAAARYAARDLTDTDLAVAESLAARSP